MTQWLYMGGYWAFVWPCYLLTAAVIGEFDDDSSFAGVLA